MVLLSFPVPSSTEERGALRRYWNGQQVQMTCKSVSKGSAATARVWKREAGIIEGEKDALLVGYVRLRLRTRRCQAGACLNSRCPFEASIFAAHSSGSRYLGASKVRFFRTCRIDLLVTKEM